MLSSSRCNSSLFLKTLQKYNAPNLFCIVETLNLPIFIPFCKFLKNFCDKPRFLSYIDIAKKTGGDILKEFKQKLEQITDYLGDKSLELDEEKLDKLVAKELEKPAGKVDAHLIDLCLNALVEYRKSITE